MSDAASLTDLLQDAQQGDHAALRSVFDVMYQELRGIARQRLAQNARNTFLDTTALVHESYLRLVNSERLPVASRRHFMRYAGHVMRSVIVDFVRESLAQRRGGDAPHVTLDSQLIDGTQPGASEILRVNDALEELARRDPRLVQVVEMRYFAGMTEAEIADALDITDRTVRRDWEKARVLLAEALR
jgi:RNA polymerase sigma factor (TIGR02999 family)